MSVKSGRFLMFSTLATLASLMVTGVSAAPVSAALELQNAFTSVSEKASPAVVVITNKQVPGRTVQFGQRLPPEFREFFGIPELPPDREPSARQVPQPAGKGSGVIIRADGYVVTNYHVIKDYDALEVKLHDGRIFDSEADGQLEIIGYDKETDLAVLRLGKGDIKNLPTLSFTDSDTVKVGQWAIAVGAPFNLDYSVTVGVVSQKGRHDVHMNTYENYIQTDASINPGNSGGPLLNLNGEIIGINNFIVTGGGGSRGNVGIGFAIASNLVTDIVEGLIRDGEVIRPWMGIAMQDMNEELLRQFGVTYGVLVNDVMEGDPADKAGIKTGDVILEIGGHKMTSPHDVQFAILSYAPGEEVPILIDRRGKRLNITVKLRRRDDSSPVVSDHDGGGSDTLEKLGMGLTVDNGNVVVAAVQPDGRAAAAGLQPGDIIREVNRQPVESVDDVLKALKETSGDEALICRERQGRKLFITIKIKD
ncbi:MAG: trypsin-like peptidase domain-containing protein [Lentisphaeria bacterium]|nr:trypsin-like peptidase domain-containing protein [Lentisphaeria bacterium]